jgi:hypothetical protein
MFARFSFEDSKAEAGLANGYAIRRDLFKLIHSREIENDAAFEGNTLPVVASAGSAHGDGNGVTKCKTEHGENFVHADGLDNDVGNFRDEQRTQNRGIPIKVVRKAVEDGGRGEDAGWIGDKLRELCDKHGEH